VKTLDLNADSTGIPMGESADPAPPEPIAIVVYSRVGCHLCEEAERLVSERCRGERFSLEIVDVDSDPALAERYGDVVPVVTVNGKVRFRGGVSWVLLNRLIVATRHQALGCPSPAGGGASGGGGGGDSTGAGGGGS
jgi:glutaredoxin